MSDLTGTVLADRYLIEGLLGRGALCTVHRARHLTLGSAVALKVLTGPLQASADSRARFLLEARTTARLRHPHVIEVLDVDTDGDRPFIAMELATGGNLRDLIRGGLPAHRSLELLAQVAEALAFAHDRGILHRDLKPENILVMANGKAKVADWGLARAMGEAPSMTQPGLILGTPAYMSPEQLRLPSAHLTGSSDLYALGIVLFETLTGRPPFAGRATLDILRAHLEEPAPPLAGCPPRLTRLVARLLAKDPVSRPPTALDVAQELASIRATLAASPPLPAPAALTFVDSMTRPVPASTPRQPRHRTTLRQAPNRVPDRSHRIDEILSSVDVLGPDMMLRIVAAARGLGTRLARFRAGGPARDDLRARLEMRFVGLLGRAGLNRTSLGALRDELPALVGTSLHGSSPEILRLLPLRYLEAALSDRTGLTPPWGDTGLLTGTRFTPGHHPPLPPGHVVIGGGSFAPQAPRHRTWVHVAPPSVLKRLAEAPFARSLAALAMRNTILDDDEELPAPETLKARTETVIDLALATTGPRPRTATVHLDVRNFSPATALRCSIDGRTAAILVNTGARSLPQDAFVLDPLVVSCRIDPTLLPAGACTIGVDAVTCPGAAPFHGVAIGAVHVTVEPSGDPA